MLALAKKKKKNRADKEGSCLRGAHILVGKTDTEQTKTIDCGKYYKGHREYMRGERRGGGERGDFRYI